MKIEVPIAGSCDVIILGGGESACRLAAELAGRQLRVRMLTPLSYFGDDSCATLRLPPGRNPAAIKSDLDRMLIDAGVDYLYQTHPVEISRDDAGRLNGLLAVNRSGFEFHRTRLVIDASPRAVFAVHCGAKRREFVPGDYDFTLNLIGKAAIGAVKAGEVTDKGVNYDLLAVTKRFHLDDNCPDTIRRALNDLKLAVWCPETLLTADRAVYDLKDDVIANTLPIGLALPGSPLELLTPGEEINWPAAENRHHCDIVRLDRCFRFADAPKVEFELNRLPELDRCDVLVAGGGTGGASAAIAAARTGCRTVCVENLSRLGGLSTVGMIGVYWYGNRVGFTTEMDKGVRRLGGMADLEPDPKGKQNIQWKQTWLRREFAAAGGELYDETLVVGAALKKGKVNGALVATPFGIGVIRAEMTIDSTGNADLAAAAGGEVYPLVGDEPAIQGVGHSPVSVGVDYHNSDYSFACDSDVRDTSSLFVAGHTKFRDHFDLAPMIGSRERRRIVGDLTLQPEDFFAHRTYCDTINIACSNFDTHGFVIHPMFLLKPTAHDPYFANVPFRALLPRNLENILVTGLGVSAHRDCLPLIRMQPDVQNQGYAAGYAAATAVLNGVGLRELDIRAVQRHLVEVAILPERVLNEDEAPGVPEAEDPYFELARIFRDPEKARVEVLARFQAAPTVEDARILAFLGCDAGKALLVETIRQTPWDKGWNYTGMGQFGMSASVLDVTVIALARIGGDRDAVLEKLRDLEWNSEFSHHRAIALALLAAPDPRAVPELVRILKTPGATGHAVGNYREALASYRPEWNDTVTRNNQLRELYLAKALAKCDPVSALARGILRSYAASLQAYYSLFASEER